MLFAAAVIPVVVVCNVLRSGREELLHREANLLEQIAGIVGSSGALLIRDTEIVDRNEHLNISLQLDDGKYAVGYVYDLFRSAAAQRPSEAAAYAIGNDAAFAAAVAAAPALAGIAYPRGKNDRVGHLTSCPQMENGMPFAR